MFLSNFQRLTNFKKGITNSLPEMNLMIVKCVRGLLMKWRDHYVVKIFNSFPFNWNAITGTKLDYHCTHYHHKTSSTLPVWMTSTSRNRWLVRMRYLRVNFKEDLEKRRCSPIKQRLCIGIAVLFVLLLCIILAVTCTRNSGPSGELLGKFAVNLTGSCVLLCFLQFCFSFYMN